MGVTLVFTVEEFIDFLKKLKDEQGFTHCAIGLNTMDGNFTVPTKKNPVYRMSMFLAGDIFKETHLGYIVSKPNIPCALLLVHQSEANQLNLSRQEIPKEILTGAGGGP